MHNTVDPDAAKLPLSDEKLGELLAYVVAHEVGHTLGLRHNHLASTAYTIDQLRDPAFANKYGPNASIMAYGRFNQAAQPGDGVTQFYPVMGPYDYFAIGWGYRTFPGLTPEERDAKLTRMAAEAAGDRVRAWAAGELPEESRSGLDPRLQHENTGADRIEATRLAGKRFAGMLEGLHDATGGDVELIRAAYDQALSRYTAQLQSVLSLVGGVYREDGESVRYVPVPAAQQRRAVAFILDEAPESLEMFEAPGLIGVLEPAGPTLTVDAHRDMLVRLLVMGVRLALLQTQKDRSADAYGAVDMGNDALELLFADLGSASHARRVMQTAFLDATAAVMDAPPDNRGLTAMVATMTGKDPDAAMLSGASGSETLFPAWARETFPALKLRLDLAAANAASEDIRLHYSGLAARLDAMLSAPVKLRKPG